MSNYVDKNKALEISPNNINTLMNLAKCKYAQKDFDTAKEHLDTLLKILPEYEEAQELAKKIEEEIKMLGGSLDEPV